MDSLRDDHRLIERMFKVLWAGLNRLERREELDPSPISDAAEFCMLFVEGLHHAKEEQMLFSKLESKGVPPHVGPLKVMVEEHTRGRVHSHALAELGKAKLDERVRADILHHGREYVSALVPHMQKEDSIVFSIAVDVLSPDELSLIADGFAAMEAELGGPELRKRFIPLIDRWERRLNVT
ncbi:MAG: hemerythrin domain-containing protein [Thermoplasmata archaeon]|jgi:hemerythrin-like domain-containing protein|nr:hemerythrin domain-containing protein [Thermoplasmata archaeon]